LCNRDLSIFSSGGAKYFNLFFIGTSIGWTGLFCPCVLFGRNVENIREDIPWTKPCICHAICIEGGIALAAVTAIFHGIDPRTSFLIGEGLLFSWWMCGIYTGLIRQQVQKKYHLKVCPCSYSQLNYNYYFPCSLMICVQNVNKINSFYRNNIFFFPHKFPCRTLLVILVRCIAACIGVPSVKSIEK